MNCFVKEAYNVIWHFYHNPHGICFCKMTDENITEYRVLFADGKEDFDVCIDENDCIHLIYQNNEGDIIYTNHFNGQWRKAVLLKSKTPSGYRKNFVIKPSVNCINAFYTIEYNNRCMLTHHIIDGKNTPPTVVDCIDGDFCVATGNDNSVYLMFYSEAAKSRGVKKLGESFVPTEIPKDCKNPFLYIDHNENMHIVYEDKGYIAHWVDGKNSDVGMGQNPVMAYQNSDMIIWEGICDNKIYIKRSDEQSPTVFMPGGFAKPVKMKLRYTCKEPNIRADVCPGNIINGVVRTYGINNFFSTIKPAEVEILKEKNTREAYQEIQKLKIQIGQMGRLAENLQTQAEEIQKINRRLEDIEEALKAKELRNNKFLL